MFRSYFSTMVLIIVLALAHFLVNAQAQVPAGMQNDASPNPVVVASKPALTPRSAHDSEPPAASPRLPSATALRIYNRAVHELHQGQTEEAAKDARRAGRIDENFADAHALAATAALVERNYPLAQAEAVQATLIDPKDDKAWVIAATADNYLGQYSQASAALNHIPQQGRATWQVAYQWARAQAGQQHPQQALEWSNRAALTAPATFAPLHLLRASALLAANQYALSAAELEAYLSLVAPDAPHHGELVEELHRLQQLARRIAPASASTAATTPEYNALAN